MAGVGISALRAAVARIRADQEAERFERQIVWMVGSPRTGTTWLVNLLAAQPGHMMIDEPGIGVHLGLFLHEFYGSPARNFPAHRSLMTEVRADEPDYFFSERYASTWKPQLRSLIMQRFMAQARAQRNEDTVCLVKEPNGSQVTGLLLDVLPESRLMWVVRDGRDVVDSMLDGTLPGGWMEEHGATWNMSRPERLRFVEDQAYRWLRRTESARAAYDALPTDRRLMVHYEQLRADTPAELDRLHAWLGREVAADATTAIADRLSYENVPDHLKGRGKFVRAAAPGKWKENLDGEEQALLERVMGPALNALGYE